MFLEVHPENPQSRRIEKIIKEINKGEVIISPTDSVYAFCCAWNQKQGIQRICQIKNIDEKDHPFSLLVKDISQLSKFTKSLDNDLFKFVKKNEKKNVTFILEADKSISRKFAKGRRKIGIRIETHPIIVAIIDELGDALISSSVKLSDDQYLPYEVDPYLIYETYQYNVPIIIDGGVGSIKHSAIVDCTVEPFELIREGSDQIEF